MMAETMEYDEQHSAFYSPLMANDEFATVIREPAAPMSRTVLKLRTKAPLIIPAEDFFRLRVAITAPGDWCWNDRKEKRVLNTVHQQYKISVEQLTSMRRTLLMEKLAKSVITIDKSLQISLSYSTGTPVYQLSFMYDLPPILILTVLVKIRYSIPELHQAVKYSIQDLEIKRDIIQFTESLNKTKKHTFWTMPSLDLAHHKGRVLAVLLAKETVYPNKLLEKLILFESPVEIVDGEDSHMISWIYVEDLFGCQEYHSVPLLRVMHQHGKGAIVWLNGWMEGFQVHPEIINLDMEQFQ